MYRLKFSLAILMLGFLLNESCKNSLKNDHSLTPEEYQKLGMPDHKKAWKLDDCKNACITLGTLKIDNQLAFPRKESKRSGEIFRRLVDEANLDFANDSALTLHIRVALMQQFMRYPIELYRLYSDNSQEKQYYNDELIDIYIFMLYENKQKLKLAFKIMNSKDKTDIGLQYGIKVVEHNYLKTIERLLNEQVKSQVFSIKDLNRLSEAVFHSLLENREWFLPADRKAIGDHIQTVIDKSPSGYIKKNYIKALKAVNDTTNMQIDILK
jgi:hypothetical protein